MRTYKKMRTAKTSQTQFEVYLNELEQNVMFRENKVTPEQPGTVKNTWECLMKKLNACGGPIKDVAGWKKTFADWKCLVRKRARAIKNAQTETGNRGIPEKPLNDIELRLLAITGEIVVEGLQGIPEVGLDDKENVEEQPQVAPVKRVKSPKKNCTITSTIAKLSEIKDGETSELKKINDNLIIINDNLKIVTEQNERKIFLMEKKLELKYNIKFEDVDAS